MINQLHGCKKIMLIFKLNNIEYSAYIMRLIMRKVIIAGVKNTVPKMGTLGPIELYGKILKTSL